MSTHSLSWQRMLVGVAVCAWLNAAALAEATSSGAASTAAPTKETRERMAQAHEKMAACLRSDRAVGDCRKDMMQACHDMGDQGCGMMMHQHMMQGSSMGAPHDMKPDAKSAK